MKMKVQEQEKALSGDPTAPSNRMLRAKIKAQIQSSTMRESVGGNLDGWMNEGAKTHRGFKGKLPEDLSTVEDLNALRAEINKLRTEPRGL